MKSLGGNIDLKKLRKIFASHTQVKLVYLFGSTARGDRGPRSDFDFAIFLGKKDTMEASHLRFQLMGDLSLALGTDKVDVVVLDVTESPELKYNIIREGKLIFEQEPFRIIFEPSALNEYFDFSALLRKHALTGA
jgi:predicted nucleotidyltransferase